MKLNYEQIRIDGGTQPRSQLLSDVISDYAEMIRAGVVFPPVTVYFDGKDYWLADGFHRLAAAKQARPQEPIEAEVIQGTQKESQWYSFGVNKCHGLRRTREDRIRAVSPPRDAAKRQPDRSPYRRLPLNGGQIPFRTGSDLPSWQVIRARCAGFRGTHLYPRPHRSRRTENQHSQDRQDAAPGSVQTVPLHGLPRPPAHPAACPGAEDDGAEHAPQPRHGCTNTDRVVRRRLPPRPQPGNHQAPPRRRGAHLTFPSQPPFLHKESAK